MGKFIIWDEKQIASLSLGRNMNHLWWFNVNIYTGCAEISRSTWSRPYFIFPIQMHIKSISILKSSCHCLLPSHLALMHSKNSVSHSSQPGVNHKDPQLSEFWKPNGKCSITLKWNGFSVLPFFTTFLTNKLLWGETKSWKIKVASG